jgi:DNA-binding CsgD family transcriptional regulator
MDLSLADGSLVAENVSQLVASGSAVLIYSIADKANLMHLALRAGAVAIGPKSQPMSYPAEIIRLAADGAIINNPETSAMIDADADFKDANLSPREREVLSFYSSGMSFKQVASHLEIRQSSAKEHIDRVRVKYARLGREAGTKVDLYRLLAEAGIRDQIRARGLQDAGLIAAVLSARKRGVVVQLSDDGGIDLLEAENKESLFKVLSHTLSGIQAGKVVIRSVAGESRTVSLFGSDPSAPTQDVFLRL